MIRKQESMGGASEGSPFEFQQRGPSKRQNKGRQNKGSALDSFEGMRRILIIITSIASAVAVVAIVFAISKINTANSIAERFATEYAQTVVATRTIEPGTVVTESDFAVASVPREMIPEDASANIADYVTGGYAQTLLSEGVPVSLSAITQSTASTSFAASLQPGTVAMMVSFSNASALSPLINVGDYVNVIGTTADDEEGENEVQFSNVKVLALDANYGTESLSNSDGYSMVTLELTLDQAVQMGEMSSLYLVLLPSEATTSEDAE